MEFASLQETFGEIYRDDRWSHGSGPGSLPKHTIEYRAFLSKFIAENEIRTVTDLGCGDWQSTHLMDWTGIHYIGLDVVKWLVDRNNEKFGRANIEFRQFSEIDQLPGGDLCICKEVLQHLPNDMVQALLEAIAERYRFALITNFVEPEDQCNLDVESGGARPLRLERAPFNARGCTVFSYNPQSGSWIFKNRVFLLFGKG
jgi:SAM-dependent methyltransferase